MKPSIAGPLSILSALLIASPFSAHASFHEGSAELGAAMIRIMMFMLVGLPAPIFLVWLRRYFLRKYTLSPTHSLMLRIACLISGAPSGWWFVSVLYSSLYLLSLTVPYGHIFNLAIAFPFFFLPFASTVIAIVGAWASDHWLKNLGKK